MDHSTELILQLQPFQRKSKVYQEIFKAEGKQFENREDAINDLRLQLSVDTATWGLAIYESELGIVTDASKPLVERRSVIKSKMRGTGKVDATLIKLVTDSFTNGDVDVAFDGIIKITFTSVVGIPPNMNDVYAAVENIKPAHLAIIYTFLYNTHQVLSGYTHLQLSSYTHEQLRSSEIS